MEQTNSRWFYLFLLISLIGIFFFPKTGYANSKWLKYYRKDGLLNTYMRTYAVLGNQLWVGTYGDGIVIYTGKKTVNFNNKNTRSRPQEDDGLISNYIKCLAIDKKRGRVWIGTNDGLCSCDLNCKNWQRFRVKNGLPNNVIRALAINEKGEVWVGTPSGIAVYDGENWKYFNEKNGLKDANIHSLKIEDGNVWAGSVGGAVSMYKNGSWTSFIYYN